MCAEVNEVRLRCLDVMAKGVSPTGGEGNTCLHKELLRMTPNIQLFLVPWQGAIRAVPGAILAR